MVVRERERVSGGGGGCGWCCWCCRAPYTNIGTIFNSSYTERLNITGLSVGGAVLEVSVGQAKAGGFVVMVMVVAGPKCCWLKPPWVRTLSSSFSSSFKHIVAGI